MDYLTTMVNTTEPSENPINFKLPSSSTMASTHQSKIPIHNLSSQSKHAEIFPSLHSSIVSIGKLCDNEWIATFDKHRFIVRKHRDNMIEGYRDPMNGLWRLPLHDPAQNNQQSNMMEQSTIKHWSQHIKPMAPRHPIAYRPTSHKYKAIFYHQILFCPTKCTLI